MIKQQEDGDDGAVTWPDGTRPLAGVLFNFSLNSLQQVLLRSTNYLSNFTFFPTGQEPVASLARFDTSIDRCFVCCSSCTCSPCGPIDFRKQPKHTQLTAMAAVTGQFSKLS